MFTPFSSQRPRATRSLLLGATVLTASVALASAAQAQTTNVPGTLTVGTPTGTAPGPVTTPLLPGTYNMAATGRLIFNHNQNTGEGYALSTAVLLRGTLGSFMEFAAGTTTLTQTAPSSRPSTITGIGGLEAVNPGPGSGGFAGSVVVRGGATLNLAQHFSWQTRYNGVAPNRVGVIEEMDTFSGGMFGGDLTVEAGGRLTGQGSFVSRGAATAATGVITTPFAGATIAGVISPHGYAGRGGRYDGPHGKFEIGATNVLRDSKLTFTPTSTYEVDVDLNLRDGPLAADTIITTLNTEIQAGAQLRIRLAPTTGPTNYLVGRQVSILQLDGASQAEVRHAFTNVNLPAGAPAPEVRNLNFTLADYPTNPAAGLIITRDALGVDGVMRSYQFRYTSTSRRSYRELNGNFTLTPDSDMRLTHYLGLELVDQYTDVSPIDINGPKTRMRTGIALEVVQQRQFIEDANTANGVAAAQAIQNVGDHNSIYTRILNLPVDDVATTQLAPFFDSLSGQLHVGVRGLMTQDAQSVQSSVGRRLSLTPEGGANFWMEGLGGRRKIDGGEGASALEEDSYGFLTGIDGTLTGPWRVGLAGGYRSAEISDPSTVAGKGDVSQWHVLGYTSGAWGAVRAHVGVGFSSFSVETDRDVSLVGVIDESLTANYDGSVVHAFGEIGYIHAMGGFEVEPFVGYRFIRAETDGVSEVAASGDDAVALNITGDQTVVSFATLGAKARTTSGPVVFDGALGWRRGFGDLALQGSHLLNNRETIGVTGAHLSESAVVAQVGARWRINDAMTLDAAYDGVIGDEGDDHTVRLGLTFGF